MGRGGDREGKELGSLIGRYHDRMIELIETGLALFIHWSTVYIRDYMTLHMDYMTLHMTGLFILDL